MPLYFRHDAFRKGQEELALDAWNAIVSHGNLMAHAPTGMGKTDAVLAAALTSAVEEDSTVFFLTPKTSQHKIALDVARGIKKKYGLGFRCTDLVGRSRMCLDAKAAGNPDFYSVCRRKREKGKCVFFEQFKANKKEAAKHVKDLAPSHLDLVEDARLLGVCPYELSLELAKTSKLVIADYNHFFVPSIRHALLTRMGRKPEETIVIADEAHNLCSRMRSERSATLKPQWVQRAAEEAAKVKNGELAAELLQLSTDLDYFLREKTAKKNEAPLTKEALLSFFASPPQLEQQLAECGEAFLEQQAGSACLRMAAFLDAWIASGDDFVLFADAGKGFRCRALDARPLTSVVNETHSTIAMSGTLLPLEMHRDLLGFDASKTALSEYPSPFPQDNRLNLFVKDVTTKYSERNDGQYSAIAFKLEKIIEEAGGRTAVFFPSFEVMREITSRIENRVLAQKPEMSSSDTEAMMLQFKESRGVLFAVAGGRLAEGMDYCNGEIKCAVVVGVPVEQKSLEQEALVGYYDKLFSRGWEYAVIFPAVNKALQAAGRGIRKESDKMVAVFMDERYGKGLYRKALPKDFTAVQTAEPWMHFRAFFEGFSY